jgi:hypothetical protein
MNPSEQRRRSDHLHNALPPRDLTGAVGPHRVHLNETDTKYQATGRTRRGTSSV